MADTSSYSIEERLVASVCVHERQRTGQTISQVIAAFRERFNKAPPRRATLLDWEKRAFALGCTVTSRPPCTQLTWHKIVKSLNCKYFLYDSCVSALYLDVLEINVKKLK